MLLKIPYETLSVPIILILMCGVWFGGAWILKRKPKPRYPSAEKRKEKALNFLLSVDDDIKLN